MVGGEYRVVRSTTSRGGWYVTERDAASPGHHRVRRGLALELAERLNSGLPPLREGSQVMRLWPALSLRSKGSGAQNFQIWTRDGILVKSFKSRSAAGQWLGAYCRRRKERSELLGVGVTVDSELDELDNRWLLSDKSFDYHGSVAWFLELLREGLA